MGWAHRGNYGAAVSGIPAWAVRGAKVVCVMPDELGTLTKDAVYTVVRAEHDGRVYLIIAELPPDMRDGWRIERFRPLITQQDDIETHFKALLDVPEQVGA